LAALQPPLVINNQEGTPRSSPAGRSTTSGYISLRRCGLRYVGDAYTTPTARASNLSTNCSMADPELISNWRRVDDRMTTSGQLTDAHLP
jgi:hypothetical protein